MLLEPRFLDDTMLEREVTLEEIRQAKADLYEWVVAHPEFQWGLVERRFHICRAHAKARVASDDALLPADFRCPLGRGDCPTRRLLGERPGHSVMLTLVALSASR